MRPSRIFIISIDTLRADRLGCYGYGRPTSPNLDRLAGEGIVYPYAFSPSTYTVPVHTSMLTGLYPGNHGLGFGQKRGKADPDSTIFLQEMLRGSGYLAGAFVSAYVLRKGWGLDWGFDVYDDNMTSAEANRPGELVRDGQETTRAALEWVGANREKDLFVFMHYFDVHGPYASGGPDARFKPEDYGDRPVLLDMVKDGSPGGIPAYQLLDARHGEDGGIVGYQRDLRHYLAGYDNGVFRQDEAVGGFLDGLKRMGLYDGSLIIVTADHGEALGEGGVYFFHGLTVTPEQARVPLIVKPGAGDARLAACGMPVSTVDIMPTVLELAGISAGGLGLDGVSLGSPEEDRFIISENEWQRAVYWREFCLLREKDVPADGFCYYFDSKDLCRGTRLIDYKAGRDLPLDPAGPAAGLIRYSEVLRRMVDPKERRIRDKDRVIFEQERLLAHKDNIIAGLMEKVAIKDEAISELRLMAHLLEKELKSVYGSKSWRLTYPVRWLTARLKGVKPS